MYKPNGEEPMTKQEELRRKEAAAERRIERMKAATSVAEVLGTTMYATLLQTSNPRERYTEASFANLR
jgi:hypothetical protein